MPISIWMSKKSFLNYLPPVRLKLVPKLKMLRIHGNLAHLIFQIYTLLYEHGVFFYSASVCLEKSLFQPQKMPRIWLHTEKGPLTALYSKPLLFMTMEANVAAWRFLMSSLTKNIWRGLKHVVYFHKILLLVESCLFFFLFSLLCSCFT